MKPRSPREVGEYVAKLDPRRELVYRLTIRGLCDRCHCDRSFTERTQELSQAAATPLYLAP